MSFFSSLKDWLYRNAEYVGLVWYTRPSLFEVHYRVQLHNRADVPFSSLLVIPLPSDSPYQQIIAASVFLPATESENRDGLYRNKYTYWNVDLNPGESKEFSSHFSFKRLPEYQPLPSQIHGRYTSEMLEKNRTYLQISPHTKLPLEFEKWAKERAKNTKNLRVLIECIHELVLTLLEYGNPIQGLYSAQEALRLKVVDCGGFSSLFVGLCLAASVPARVVSGFWAGYPNNEMHAWAEVLLPDGTWRTVDSATDYLRRQHRTRKLGSLFSCGSDRVTLSVGCDLPLHINDKTYIVDILQHPVLFPTDLAPHVAMTTTFEAQRV